MFLVGSLNKRSKIDQLSGSKVLVFLSAHNWSGEGDQGRAGEAYTPQTLCLNSVCYYGV